MYSTSKGKPARHIWRIFYFSDSSLPQIMLPILLTQQLSNRKINIIRQGVLAGRHQRRVIFRRQPADNKAAYCTQPNCIQYPYQNSNSMSWKRQHRINFTKYHLLKLSNLAWRSLSPGSPPPPPIACATFPSAIAVLCKPSGVSPIYHTN
jgi:hypothetical protein